VIAKAPKGMHVHHLNGNSVDNRPENLVVLTAEAHQAIHAPTLTTRWAKEYDACIACGETTRPHASKGRCTRCNQRK
jgi:hypothetical protein